MECLKCHHVSSEAAKIKCSQCGQTYPCESFEEYQHLAFLKEWVNAHQKQLGTDFNSLLSEIEEEESVLFNSFGIHLRPRADIARELTLTQGTLGYIAIWKRNADPGIMFYLLGEYLEKRVGILKSELGELLRILPLSGELEAINFVLESLPTWQKDPNLSKATRLDLLKTNMVDRKNTLLTPPPVARPKDEVERELALLNSAIHFMPGWSAQVKTDKAFMQKLMSFLHTQARQLSNELGDQQTGGEPPSEAKTIDTFLKSMANWYGTKIHESGSIGNLCRFLYARRKELQSSPAAGAKAALKVHCQTQSPFATAQGDIVEMISAYTVNGPR
jgi:hypothetical protein